jgi:hypothetical protein
MGTERRDRRAKEEVVAGEGDATVAWGNAERAGLAATTRERESGRGNGEAAHNHVTPLHGCHIRALSDFVSSFILTLAAPNRSWNPSRPSAFWPT